MHAGLDALDALADAARSAQLAASKPKIPPNLTIKDIIDAGLLNPGRNNVAVTYKGITYTASLMADGAIQFEGVQIAVCCGTVKLDCIPQLAVLGCCAVCLVYTASISFLLVGTVICHHGLIAFD